MTNDPLADLPDDDAPGDDIVTGEQLDRIEELVADCLESDSLEEAVRDACDAEPALASQIRSSIRELQRHALLAEPVPVPERKDPERVGGFRLVRKLGQGGMGVVYEAEEIALGRRVALKVLRPELLHFGGNRERFRREIEVVARLQHPGIVPIYHAGESEGLPFFTMELVEGESISKLLQGLRGRDLQKLRGTDLRPGEQAPSDASQHARGPVEQASWPDACVQVVLEVAEALEHAHALGILHRDVKPSNVLITPSGRARLLDFGLARAEDSQELTRSGSELGSLPYLPPERLRDDKFPPDPRHDVWGLGVLLLELLTLENPFLGPSRNETRQRILDAALPNARRKNSQITRELATVIETALAPEIATRYANISALRRDLENLLAHRPIEAQPAGFGLRAFRFAQRHRAASLAAIVSIPLLLAALWLGEHRLRVASDEQRIELARERAATQRALYVAKIALADRHLESIGSGTADALTTLHGCEESARRWEWDFTMRRANMCLTQLLPASDQVRAVVCSPKRDVVFSASRKTRILAQGPGGELLWEHECERPVQALCIDGEARRLLALTGSHTLLSLNPRTGAVEATREFRAPVLEILALRHASGNFLLACKHEIHRLDFADLRSVATWHTSQAVTQIAPLTDERFLTGHEDGRLRVWNAKRSEDALHTLRTRFDTCRALVQFSEQRVLCVSTTGLGPRVECESIDLRPNGSSAERIAITQALHPKRIQGTSIVACGKSNIEIWDLAIGRRVGLIRGPRLVRQIDIGRRGVRAYVASAEGLQAYGVFDRLHTTPLHGLTSIPTSLAFSPSGARLAASDSGLRPGTTSSSLAVWPTKQASLPRRVVRDGAHDAKVVAVGWVEEERLLSVDTRGTLRAWNEALEQKDEVLLKAPVTSMWTKAGSAHLICADGRLITYSAKPKLAQESARSTKLSEAALTHISDGPRPQTLAIGTADAQIFVVHAVTHRVEQRFACAGPVKSVAFGPKQDVFVVLFGRNDAELRDAQSGERIRSWTFPEHPSSKVAFGVADRFYTADNSGLLRVHDPHVEGAVLTSSPTSSMLTTLAVHPASGLIAVGGYRKRIQLLRGSPAADR